MLLDRLSTPIQMLTFMPAAAAVDEKAAKSVAFNRAGKCDSSKKLVPGEITLESSAGEEEGESRRMIRSCQH